MGDLLNLQKIVQIAYHVNNFEVARKLIHVKSRNVLDWCWVISLNPILYFNCI